MNPIRVTTEADGTFVNQMPGYWSNAFVRDRIAYAFVGHVDGRPRFFQVNLDSRQVAPLEPLLPYRGTGENWTWDQTGKIILPVGPQLRRVDPFNPADDEVLFDISATMPGHDLWQPHSSDDGLTHSATVRKIGGDEAWPYVLTVVFKNGVLRPFPKLGKIDESRLTRNGRWLIITETIDGSEDNRVFDLDLETNEEWRIPNSGRAVGHADCEWDSIVGEADEPDPGVCGRWDLATRTFTPLFPTTGMGHISTRAGRILISGQTHLSLFENGALRPIWAHGMVGDPKNYEYQAQGNLSPGAEVVAYMSNEAGHLDLYLLVLERQG